MTDTNERIRARITRGRESLGLGQREAAQRAGMSQSTWHRLETGDKALKVGDLLGVAHALGTTIGYLTGDSDLMDRVLIAARTDGHEADTTEVEDHLRHLMEMDSLFDELEARAIA